MIIFFEKKTEAKKNPVLIAIRTGFYKGLPYKFE